MFIMDLSYVLLSCWSSFPPFLICQVFLPWRLLNFVKCFSCISWCGYLPEEQSCNFLSSRPNILKLFKFCQTSRSEKVFVGRFFFFFFFFKVLVLGQFYPLLMSFPRLWLVFWLTEVCIYLFLAVLGLRCCSPAFSVCGAWGLLFVVRCLGVALQWLLLWQNPDSRHMRFGSCGARALELRFHSCSFVACGLFLEEGSNLCPLRWQAESHPLHHPESPICLFLMK